MAEQVAGKQLHGRGGEISLTRSALDTGLGWLALTLQVAAAQHQQVQLTQFSVGQQRILRQTGDSSGVKFAVLSQYALSISERGMLKDSSVG
jgi:hypothetical protein